MNTIRIANNHTGVEAMELAADGAMGGQEVVLNTESGGRKYLEKIKRYILTGNR